jgi:hypothetical protein
MRGEVRCKLSLDLDLGVLGLPDNNGELKTKQITLTNYSSNLT